MSNPSNEPRFVTCRCQHCDGHIEFDAASIEPGEIQKVECPHCQCQTVISIPNTSSQTHEQKQPALEPPPILKSVKGTVLDFTIQSNAGIISGDDGLRYMFKGSEWKEVEKYPAKGMRVDFSPQGGAAHVIYLLRGSGLSASKTGEGRECDKLVASLLAIFLGGLGIHKFYIGQSRVGVIYIIAVVVTLGFGLFITALIGLVEGIIYLSISQEEFERKYVRHSD